MLSTQLLLRTTHRSLIVIIPLICHLVLSSLRFVFPGLAKVKFSADVINVTTLNSHPPAETGAGPAIVADQHIDDNNTALSVDGHVVNLKDDANHSRLNGVADGVANDDSTNVAFTVLDAPGTESSNRAPDPSGSTMSGHANPWSLAMYRKQLSPSRCGVTGVVNCMLLENLTSKFKFPCVLDVKVGTRLYDDNADAKKRERCNAKAASTTTMALGVRICGMQVYNPKSGKYLCQDKYHGRSLTPKTISEALRQYFELNSGNPLVSSRSRDIIFGFVERIQKLQQVVTNQKGMRFYSSSLLLMYDGDPSNDSPNIDIRMIDFAHTTFSSKNSPLTENERPDEGYLFGLKNLETRLSALVTGSSTETIGSSPETSNHELNH